MRNFILFLVLSIPTLSQAQVNTGGFPTMNNGYWPWGWPRASTAAEGYLNGVGHLAIANGYYWESISRAHVLQEEAQAKAILNRGNRIRDGWALRDEYRLRTTQKPATELEAKRLQGALERHELRLLEQKLITDGVLPPKKATRITIFGRHFSSLTEAKASVEWQSMIFEAQLRANSRMISDN